MKISSILTIILAFISLSLPACHKSHAEQPHEEHHKIVVTSPMVKDVTITQQYVCQIRSRCNTDICALANGFLMEIPITEGQLVKKGDPMFQILPILYKTRLDAELAEVQLAQQEFNNTERLVKTNIVSANELALFQAKLLKAQAKAKQAEAELSFTVVRAPFDGIVDRLVKQQGSKIKEDDVLTNLSDNSTMWVYFNVPEVRYLEFKAHPGQDIECQQIELVLANGSKFPQKCQTVTPMSKVNNETGNFSYRADFPNLNGLLRHGQTGNILIHRTLKNAIVIPQRATFETLDKRYVWVIDKEEKTHQREIIVDHELDDIFVIKSGLSADDKIVLEGKLQVHDNEKVKYDFDRPQEVLTNLKRHAE
ncbi:MAG: efflux RND transporter periplasmic adaptor subunit [Planctomycetes bacterium]|nr:efflux RND transporter periplasmic adaptor subunit [Planctomycetota bacterium]